jgi:UDP-GlcNAc:undecaprenyl-phosphate GlcNAc-1-phosphate transferase
MLFVFSFLASLFLVLFSVPWISRLAAKRQLFDDSRDRRKIHQVHIPHFGGLAIYLGVLVPGICTYYSAVDCRFLLLASLIVFLTGLVDDFIPVSPGPKFLFQFAAAFLLVVVGDIRILRLEHVLSYDDLPYLQSIALTVWFMVGLINAYNLIDGIDGLAACLALFLFAVYGILFFNAGLLALCLLCCSAVGALAGFLFFNLSSRRKIFMGDCGSLFLGLLAAFASIKVLAIGESRLFLLSFPITAKIALVLALLSIPVFDTLRVLVLRLASGRSPFRADDNHIHHRLLSLGLTHLQATGVLCFVNLILACLALLLQELGNTMILLLLGLLLLLLNCLLYVLLQKTKVFKLRFR